MTATASGQLHVEDTTIKGTAAEKIRPMAINVKEKGDRRQQSERQVKEESEERSAKQSNTHSDKETGNKYQYIVNWDAFQAARAQGKYPVAASREELLDAALREPEAARQEAASKVAGGSDSDSVPAEQSPAFGPLATEQAPALE